MREVLVRSQLLMSSIQMRHLAKRLDALVNSWTIFEQRISWIMAIWRISYSRQLLMPLAYRSTTLIIRVPEVVLPPLKLLEVSSGLDRTVKHQLLLKQVGIPPRVVEQGEDSSSILYAIVLAVLNWC